MFDSYENRRKSDRGMWKAFAAVALLFAGGVWVYTKVSHARAEAKYEDMHRAYLKEAEDSRKPALVNLPGMSITAPGKGIESGDYEHGSYMGASPVEFGVQWIRTGTIPRMKVVELIQGSYKKSYNWDLEVVAEKQLAAGQEDVLKGEHGGMLIVTQLECGKRQVTLLVDDALKDVREISDQMVASFHCTPDPTIDVARPSVVVDSIKGWKRATNRDVGSNVLALTGPHGEQMRTAKLDRHEGSVADQITSMVDGTAIQLVGKPTTRNDKVFWQGVNAADQKPSAILAWRCEDDRVALITIIAPTSVDEAVAVADTGRCLKADEAVPIYN